MDLVNAFLGAYELHQVSKLNGVVFELFFREHTVYDIIYKGKLINSTPRDSTKTSFTVSNGREPVKLLDSMIP